MYYIITSPSYLLHYPAHPLSSLSQSLVLNLPQLLTLTTIILAYYLVPLSCPTLLPTFLLHCLTQVSPPTYYLIHLSPFPSPSLFLSSHSPPYSTLSSQPNHFAIPSTSFIPTLTISLTTLLPRPFSLFSAPLFRLSYPLFQLFLITHSLLPPTLSSLAHPSYPALPSQSLTLLSPTSYSTL